jgi:hypothetical protein
MLLDTGADVSLLPRASVTELLGSLEPDAKYEIQGFDGKRSFAPAVDLEMRLLNKSFGGQFLVTDQEHGILGRNVLNSLSLCFDGPRQQWDEYGPSK